MINGFERCQWEFTRNHVLVANYTIAYDLDEIHRRVQQNRVLGEDLLTNTVNMHLQPMDDTVQNHNHRQQARNCCYYLNRHLYLHWYQMLSH